MDECCDELTRHHKRLVWFVQSVTNCYKGVKSLYAVSICAIPAAYVKLVIENT